MKAWLGRTPTKLKIPLLRLVRTASQAGILLLGVAVLCIASYKLAPRPTTFVLHAARAAALPLSARDPMCPFSESATVIADFLWSRRKIEERLYGAMRRLAVETDGSELWDTPIGRFWVPPGNVGSLAYLLTEFERKSNGAGRQGVRDGDIVLDCGANLGTFTKEALMAGARTVVAIEPSPANLQCLRKTFAEELVRGQVVIFPRGVWDREDSLTLFVHPGGTGVDSFVVKGGTDSVGVEVSLTTIDRLVEELRLTRVDFIKMDIEGAEQRALAGARSTLSRFAPRLAISGYHLPDDTVAIPRIVRSSQPDYRMECGTCYVNDWRIVPETLFFRLN